MNASDLEALRREVARHRQAATVYQLALRCLLEDVERELGPAAGRLPSVDLACSVLSESPESEPPPPDPNQS